MTTPLTDQDEADAQAFQAQCHRQMARPLEVRLRLVDSVRLSQPFSQAAWVPPCGSWRLRNSSARAR